MAGGAAARPTRARLARTRFAPTPFALVPPPGRPRPASVPFERTTRWLRGRLVDRLRDAAPGTALAIDGPLGAHSAQAVTLALAGLARDGIVELDAAGRARLADAPEPA